MATSYLLKFIQLLSTISILIARKCQSLAQYAGALQIIVENRNLRMYIKKILRGKRFEKPSTRNTGVLLHLEYGNVLN
jgi:hypothetical protein